MPITEANKPVLYVAAAVLMNSKRQILVAQRPEGKSMAGYWEFPGGKIEAGEIPEDALIRELKEELDIICHRDHMQAMNFVSYAYPKFHLFMPLWLVTSWQGEINPQEQQAFQWIEPMQLHTLQMPPADKPLIQTIEQFFSA